MQAAVAYPGERQLKLEEVAVPALDEGDVLVRVRAAGITRGLLSLWRGGRIKLLPGILGHESAGEVAATSPGVTGVAEGQRVRVHSNIGCGHCRYCTSGDDPLCAQAAIIGHTVFSEAAMPQYERYHNGGLAEYMKVPAANLEPLPDSVPYDVAARLGSLGVSYRSLRRSNPHPGDTVVVTAASGSAGAGTIKCAPLFGVDRVIAVARSRPNLERVQALEPELVEVLPTDELDEGWRETGGLTKRILSSTDGAGADAVVDYVPGDDGVTTTQAIAAMRRGGTAVITGGNRSQLCFAYTEFMRSNHQLVGSNGGGRQDTRDLIAHLDAGHLDVSALITHRMSLADIDQAVEAVDGSSSWWVVVEF